MSSPPPLPIIHHYHRCDEQSWYMYTDRIEFFGFLENLTLSAHPSQILVFVNFQICLDRLSSIILPGKKEVVSFLELVVCRLTKIMRPIWEGEKQYFSHILAPCMWPIFLSYTSLNMSHIFLAPWMWLNNHWCMFCTLKTTFKPFSAVHLRVHN